MNTPKHPTLPAQAPRTSAAPVLMSHKTWLAAALLMGSAPWAVAQDSTVTLFGTVAASALNLSHQANGTGTRLVSGPWTAPSYGLRGSEALGGGLTASFRLESSLDLPTGGAGRTVLGSAKHFDKAAWVGLGNQQLNLTAGRQLHAGIDRIAETLDVFHANADGKLLLSILALNATNTFGGFDTRVDDAVKLRAQLPGGVKLGVSHAFASAGRVGRSQSMDLGLQTPGYGLGAYVLRYNSDGTQLQQNTWGLGGNVLVGSARLYAHYMDATHDKSAGGATEQNNQVWGLGVAMPITPALSMKAAYYRDSASSVGGTAGREGQRSTVALMGDYAFSKRTSLNFGVFRHSLSGALAADPTSLAVLGLIDPATRNVSGSATTGVAVGLNHRF
ncbi:porin [Hydrogenophaga sp. D2P1]|uniref:Porin n=1 Tax=Hydrogenophaga aromaticivorans TaxID=2610898 RepID=A0A7Y8GVF5_9BURK|nr:porin [Hydrogenophaga aromaticivorans]NWF45577.1 porin [Hydrogenophaga aromaticivorans]